MSTTLNYIHDAGYPFQVAATRYIPKDAAEDGLTLILAHANRLHKEPCGILAQSLIELSQNNGRNRSLSIRDIWSIESPIHGETEGPDRGDVGVRHDNEGSDWEYSRAVLSFLDSQPDGVNFYERDIVAIGHGQGGNTLALLHALKPRLPIISFVLLNPDIDSSSAPARAYEYAAPRVMDYQPRVVDVLHKLYARGPPVHLVLSAADDIRAKRHADTM
ncbi:hypothetical protein BXZ70DRAFT_1056416 [Cristinia sonorae]|uniref:AB hydrolase-1 domain-containing protein n=1 Tax=Cristinia sonorae TaxID=1940300 RepID=A0A8K0UE10_9AGAR|nr:hypothetical protein BXZ70DRAFT_1056416 [Cristinia sonorae]